jgi:hypothetical protein
LDCQYIRFESADPGIVTIRRIFGEFDHTGLNPSQYAGNYSGIPFLGWIYCP